MKSTLYHRSEHLSEDALLPQEHHCPICGFEGTRSKLMLIQQDPDIDLLSCPSCHGASASRIPSQKALDAYYNKYYDDREDTFTIAGSTRFARHVLSAAELPVLSGARKILDFGGGDGSLAVAIARQLQNLGEESIDITTVDYQPCTKITDPGIDIRRVGELSEADGRYDLVLASAILEHLPDPLKTLQGLLQCLRPGGIFYARTPYVAPLRYLGRVDLCYPGHLHDMGADFWNEIMTRMDTPLELLISRPSLVETSFNTTPLRTLAAWLLKAPAHLEIRLRGVGSSLHWHFVGGWEVVVRKNADIGTHA